MEEKAHIYKHATKNIPLLAGLVCEVDILHKQAEERNKGVPVVLPHVVAVVLEVRCRVELPLYVDDVGVVTGC